MAAEIDSAWPIEFVGDLAAADGGAIAIGPFGSSMKADVYTESGIPVVRGNNLTGRPGFHGDLVYISEVTASRFARCLVKPGDLVFPHRGAIGEVGLVVEQGYDTWMLSTSMMKFRPAAAKLDSWYAYYYFRSSLGRHQLLQNASQVGTPGIGQPLASLRACEMPLPPLAVQKDIVDVLRALDDKIEQNRRTSRASARLAHAIFRAWFVDFEPIHAKAAGATSFPSMPQEVFDSLPTIFIPSDLGPIPEGWQAKALSEVVQLTMGQSPSSEFYNEAGDGLSFHQGVTDFGYRFPSHRVYCTTGGRIAETNDVLLSVRAPVGRINVADRRLILGRGLAGLRHRSNRQSFLLQQMRDVFSVEDAIGDGTVYMAVTKKFLAEMPLLVPSEDAEAAFEKLVLPIDSLIAASERESRTLAMTRDYLLPRLLSGKVRVGVIDG